ncbi:MAG TPA: hypothetical protein VJN39_05030 [Gemmatimonadales bacterium]|nr:hypothetical protein [Gemmatimonadales bacterium]
MTSLRLALILVSPVLAGGTALAAQAVERSDVPERGVLRVTFDPRVMTWNDQFTGAGRVRLGAPLTGDTVGGRFIPAVARLEQSVRIASGIAGFVASLGQGLLSVRQERRTYPIAGELGITDRLSVSLLVPIVRVATRSSWQRSNVGANLGLNPRLAGAAGADAAYTSFFTQFDTTLTRFDQNISAGQYGCTSTAPCAARDSSTRWHAVRDALRTSVYGAGLTGSPFLPLGTSAAGLGIDTTVARIERGLSLTYGVPGFDTTTTFLLPTDMLTDPLVNQALIDPRGFGYAALPFRSSWRYGLGDVELGAKYRLAAGERYAAALQAIVRLPTAGRDSADDLLRQSLGDRQLDLEGHLTQELAVGPLWLNVAVHAGLQRPGTRVRRVAPPDAFLVPATATATLRWDPGDYAGVDVAPLLRLSREFAAGFTAGYFTKARDHYAYQSAQDSLDLATRTGAATPASVLEAGTSERRLRLGFAVTYHAPMVEGGFSIEQTVSGRGGLVPGATVYRIVMRASQKLF